MPASRELTFVSRMRRVQVRASRGFQNVAAEVGEPPEGGRRARRGRQGRFNTEQECIGVLGERFVYENRSCLES